MTNKIMRCIKPSEVGEFPGGRGGFSSWEVREGQRSERRLGSVERFERIFEGTAYVKKR